MASEIVQRILEATLEVIAREKISGTRMHLIAKEANMVQSNLHYYFPTKNDLMIALFDDLQQRFTEKRMSSVDLVHKSFSENVHGLFEEKKDDILCHDKIDYAQFDYWVQGTVNSEIREKFQKSFTIWRENILEVLKSGPVSEKIDSKDMDMVPFLIVSLMMGASMQYLIDVGKFDLDEYFGVAEKMIKSFLKIED